MAVFTAKVKECGDPARLGWGMWAFKVFRDGEPFDVYPGEYGRTNQLIWFGTPKMVTRRAERELERCRKGVRVVPERRNTIRLGTS